MILCQCPVSFCRYIKYCKTVATVVKLTKCEYNSAALKTVKVHSPFGALKQARIVYNASIMTILCFLSEPTISMNRLTRARVAVDISVNKEIKEKINVNLGYWELLGLQQKLLGPRKDVQVVTLLDILHNLPQRTEKAPKTRAEKEGGASGEKP